MKITHEKLKDIVKLEQKKYRNEEGKYLIFGKHIVEEALKYSDIIEVLVTQEQLYDYYKEYDLDVYIISDKQKTKFKSLKTVPEVLAVCQKRSDTIDFSKTILGINKINNPDNLGAILRSAKAFGIENIILDYETVDLYNTKTIQAMQGVNFSMNIIYDDLYSICQKKIDKDHKLITTFLDEPSQINNNMLLNDKKYFIILGNEAQGIENKFKSIEHLNFKIDIVYESLNVAHAGSIIMYEFSKGRLRKD